MLPEEWLEEFDDKCTEVEKAYKELFAYAATIPTNLELKEEDKDAILQAVINKMDDMHQRALM
jgi:hypothetical protein